MNIPYNEDIRVYNKDVFHKIVTELSGAVAYRIEEENMYIRMWMPSCKNELIRLLETDTKP